MRRCPICNCKVKNCICQQFAQTCKTCRTKGTLDEEGNCTCTEIEMPVNPPTMSVSTNLQEPPDISVLKDRSRLDYYITALKRWSGLAKATGTQDVFHADIVLDRAFRTYPELYMEMSDKFCDTLKEDSDGIEKIITWLSNKFGMNKHADMVRILNQFYNTTRMKDETLIDYIARLLDSNRRAKQGSASTRSRLNR